VDSGGLLLSGSGAKGRRFESCRARHTSIPISSTSSKGSSAVRRAVQCETSRCESPLSPCLDNLATIRRQFFAGVIGAAQSGRRRLKVAISSGRNRAYGGSVRTPRWARILTVPRQEPTDRSSAERPDDQTRQVRDRRCAGRICEPHARWSQGCAAGPTQRVGSSID
jgi:hypothetical protein